MNTRISSIDLHRDVGDVGSRAQKPDHVSTLNFFVA